MLRKTLITLGFFVAIVPYLGFPSSWKTVMLTAAGLSIVALLLLSRRPHARGMSVPNFLSIHSDGKEVRDSVREISEDDKNDTPINLHVEHTEVEERPLVHIERETIVDTENIGGLTGTETTVEKKITITRKRRKKETDREETAVSSEGT